MVREVSLVLQVTKANKVPQDYPVYLEKKETEVKQELLVNLDCLDTTVKWGKKDLQVYLVFLERW